MVRGHGRCTGRRTSGILAAARTCYGASDTSHHLPMTDDAVHWRVAVDGDTTSACFEPAAGAPTGTLAVLAHGAGGHMRDGAMNAAVSELRRRGVDVVRFNFVYRDAGSRRPDPMPRLQACVAAVADHARNALPPVVDARVKRLVVGGRSMGGRAASMLVADGWKCAGLVLLAYPLHPANEPGKLRDAHLPRIAAPVLCLNGTRDALCRRDLMDDIVGRLGANWTMHWLDGADHSFHVLKSSGRTDTDVLAEAGAAWSAWERTLDDVR